MSQLTLTVDVTSYAPGAAPSSRLLSGRAARWPEKDQAKYSESTVSPRLQRNITLDLASHCACVGRRQLTLPGGVIVLSSVHYPSILCRLTPLCSALLYTLTPCRFHWLGHSVCLLRQVRTATLRGLRRPGTTHHRAVRIVELVTSGRVFIVGSSLHARSVQDSSSSPSTSRNRRTGGDSPADPPASSTLPSHQEHHHGLCGALTQVAEVDAVKHVKAAGRTSNAPACRSCYRTSSAALRGLRGQGSRPNLMPPELGWCTEGYPISQAHSCTASPSPRPIPSPTHLSLLTSWQ